MNGSTLTNPDIGSANSDSETDKGAFYGGTICNKSKFYSNIF